MSLVIFIGGVLVGTVCGLLLASWMLPVCKERPGDCDRP